MPQMKKTSTTNKKKNKKIQQQKNIQEAKKKKMNDEVGWINDEKSSENYKFAKMFNAKVFQYYKNNMILFKIGSKEENSIKQKLISNFKKGIDKQENYGIIPFRKHNYMIKKEYLDKLTEFMISAINVPLDCSADAKTVKDIIMNLIINNPKPNGESDNFSIGFLGSVWIDTKDKTGKLYRLAFYNNGGKDYSGVFKPSIMFMDN